MDNNESILRGKARELIRAGRLPDRRPDRVWGGAGFEGSPCGLCGVPLKEAEMAVELEFARDLGLDPDSANLHLHARCFLAMELELLQRDAAKMQSLDDGPGSSMLWPGGTHAPERPLP
jgi:hypothetical protein